MFCQNCGTQNNASNKFCSNCGALINGNAPTTRPSAPPQRPNMPPQGNYTQAPGGYSANQTGNAHNASGYAGHGGAPVQHGGMPTQHGSAPNQYNGAPGQGQYPQGQHPQGQFNAPNYQAGQSPNQFNNYANTPNGNYVQPNNYGGAPQRKKSKGCLSGCLIALVVAIVFFLFIGWLFSDVEDYDSDYYSNSEAEYTEPSENDVYGTYGNDLQIENLRDYYTTPKGDGSDVHTVMMYMIGSDLESESGAATEDIYEMAAATYGDNINLILMTGGATYWYHNDISNYSSQYWQLADGEMNLLHDFGEPANMVSPETLTSFINDTAASYPADRYSLIMWDHGGGTIGGFGYDEYFPEYTLTLSDIDYALSLTDVKFDFVGFDACLMATAETALMLEPYADYLIASQELEPGIGWYYTDWLTALNNNPSMSTLDIGVNIVEDFVNTCMDTISDPEATLSVVELREMPYTYSVLTEYFSNATQDIYNNEYPKISGARSDTKDFGDGEYEQIDIVDFIQKAGVEGELEAISAVNSVVKYYYNSYDVYNAHGLAMYFPYDYPEYYSQYQEILHEVGMGGEYTDFFNTFVSAMSGGQMQRSKNSGGDVEHDYSTEDWYDAQTADNYAEEYSGEFLEELVIDEKGDSYVLSLTDEEWEEITRIELQALLDDGEGYIDLGSDNVFEIDADGDLLIEFDYTWVTLDGFTVPFYVEDEQNISDDNWSTYGMVPAYLNGEQYIEIIVTWTNEEPLGYVAGYRVPTEIGAPAGKGLFQFEQGDTIEYVFDYYTYDWEYDGSYIIGDVYTYSGGDIAVSYDDVGDLDAVVYFVLYDVYNNIYETEAVLYTD